MPDRKCVGCGTEAVTHIGGVHVHDRADCLAAGWEALDEVEW